MNEVLILGDSYSTFLGYIPEGYAPHYGNPLTRTDVKKVEETWWHMLTSERGETIAQNNSWSGSTICYTAYNNVDCSKINSFIFRLNELEKSGFFKEHDVKTLYIFGGTNDNWANAPVGKVQYDNFTHKDLFSVLPATCYLVKRAKEIIPSSRIVVIINSELKREITDGMKECAMHYNVPFVELHDVDKTEGHPTKKGMTAIKDQIQQVLQKIDDKN